MRKDRKQKDKTYYERHKAIILAKKKIYNAKNKKRIGKQKRKHYEANQEIMTARTRHYYKKHRAKMLKKAKERRLKNIEKFKAKDHKYYVKNKEKIRKRQNEYDKKHKRRLMRLAIQRQKERRKTDIQFRITCILRSRLQKVIQNDVKQGSAVKNLGCSIEFLIAYIQDKFYGKMSWDNYGTYWELDHIVPFWKFDLTDKKQLLKAINYTNLQPLTKKDHKKKTAKEAKERLTKKISK